MQELTGCLFVLVTAIFLSIPALCACSVSGKVEQHHGCKKNALFEKRKRQNCMVFSAASDAPSPHHSPPGLPSCLLSLPLAWPMGFTPCSILFQAPFSPCMKALADFKVERQLQTGSFAFYGYFFGEMFTSRSSMPGSCWKLLSFACYRWWPL